MKYDAVQLNLLGKLVRPLNADVFYITSGRKNSSAVSRLRPVVVQDHTFTCECLNSTVAPCIFHDDRWKLWCAPTKKVYLQFWASRVCYHAVEAAEERRGHRYEHIVKMRPDLVHDGTLTTAKPPCAPAGGNYAWGFKHTVGNPPSAAATLHNVGFDGFIVLSRSAAFSYFTFEGARF